MSYYYPRRRGDLYFDTSYDKGSAYERARRDRHKVNVAFFPDQYADNIYGAAPSCPDCKQQYIVVDDGVNYFCKVCGERVPVQKIKQEKKLVQKHGTPKGKQIPIISSQSTDPRRREPSHLLDNEMDEETRRDLEGFGFHPE